MNYSCYRSVLSLIQDVASGFLLLRKKVLLYQFYCLLRF